MVNYLIIGHITKDNTADGAILGGTCSYAAITAHQLGQQVAIVTSFGPDIPSLDRLAEIEIENLPANQSTTFENSYQNGVRHQKWLVGGAPLALENVPLAWRNAPIVHLAPVAQEISPSMCGDFPNSLLCVTMQGWLRGQDANNQVIYQPRADLEAWLTQIDVLVLSLADLSGDRAMLTHFLTSAKLGVETLGAEGCRVYHNGQVEHVPVKPEVEIDATGAGDIFAATFFVYYHKTANYLTAARYANACASLSVLKVGLESIPTLSQVEARLRMYS